jgi:hypothetical protein
MIIDLDSWEEGYGDGLVGRPSRCTPGLDHFSYSSGYSQARANPKGTREGLQQGYARLPTQRASQSHGRSSRLIIV